MVLINTCIRDGGIPYSSVLDHLSEGRFFFDCFMFGFVNSSVLSVVLDDLNRGTWDSRENHHEAYTAVTIKCKLILLSYQSLERAPHCTLSTIEVGVTDVVLKSLTVSHLFSTITIVLLVESRRGRIRGILQQLALKAM